jgi:outer membrane protein OmpA-like peptidoglycan-associated protein
MGSVTYNQALSERRAKAAHKYLQEIGAPLAQLVLLGSSELKPIDSNDNSAGRQNNRRVEFRILYQGSVLVESAP